MTEGTGRAALSVSLTILPSPWGPVLMGTTPRGVLAVELRASPATMRLRLERRLASPVELDEAAEVGRPADRSMRPAVEFLRRVLAGEPVDAGAVALDWTGVNAWDRRVLEGARTVARGEVTGYGRLARRIGAPGAARAVGAALGRNPFWLFVPCHRVVAGDGSIGGYGDEPDALDIKRDLLALEGVAVPIARLVD